MESQAIQTAPPAANPAERFKSRGGAPQGNKNRISHGLRANRLPDGCASVQGELNAFRRLLLDQLESIHGRGAIPLSVMIDLQEVMRHEACARLAARWLRMLGEAAPLDDRQKMTREIRDSTKARAAALARLGIDPPDSKTKPATKGFIDSYARKQDSSCP